MWWLIAPGAWQEFLNAIKVAPEVSAERVREFEARYFEDSNNSPGSRILTISGSEAIINVNGIMTQAPNYLAYYYGGGNTTYPEISGAAALAENDPRVKKVKWLVSSPGGQTDGLFGMLEDVAAMKKPTEAVVTNMAASAAYALVSQMGKITAANRAARFGSIGIVVGMPINEGMVRITSTKAPAKAPDPTTEEGRAMIREELDAMHELFTSVIADGRKTTQKNIDSNYGKGGVYLAEEALKRGMIDAVQQPADKVNSGGTKTKGARAMVETVEQLQAEAPAVYEAVLAIGIAKGKAAEKDRVTAHIVCGEAAGDLTGAVKAIREGEEMTETKRMEYLVAVANRGELSKRGGDDTELQGAADTAGGGTDGDDNAPALSLLEQKYGLEG